MLHTHMVKGQLHLTSFELFITFTWSHVIVTIIPASWQLLVFNDIYAEVWIHRLNTHRLVYTVLPVQCRTGQSTHMWADVHFICLTNQQHSDWAAQAFHLVLPIVPQHLQPVHHSLHTCTQPITFSWQTEFYMVLIKNKSFCMYAHTQLHTRHNTVREHPSTPQRVPGSCVVKIYMTRWQTDSGRAAILPVSLLMLTVL